MKRIYFLAILAALLPRLTWGQSIVINEIMASNGSTLADATGEYSDWIELYNPTNATVDLSGYYLTDKPSNPKKHQLPSGVSIAAGGYLILWASSEPSRGDTHLGFSLSASGEFVGLYQPDGSTTVDAISFGPQRADISWGRKPNQTGGWFFLVPASPANGNEAASAYDGFLDPPLYSQQAGFYTNAISLALSTPEAGATIYYTLDGSEPNPSQVNGATYIFKNQYPGDFNLAFFRSFVYQNPITITNRSAEENRLSTRNNSYENYYPTPTQSVFKGTPVRAVVYKAGYLSSEIATNTYYVSPLGNNRYALPVVSVTVPEKSLYDYNSGIYTAGAVFEGWRMGHPSETPNPGSPANYSQTNGSWEKAAHFELFDPVSGGSLSKRIKLETHGGWSRAYARKSLRVTIQNQGGSDVLGYPLFPDRPYQNYHSFLLRNSGQDWDQTLLRDATVQEIMRELPFDTQAYRPAVVFMNGEYWGIHNLRERSNEDYLVQKYDLNPDYLDLLENNMEVNEGSAAHYMAMLNFVDSNDLTDSTNFAYLRTQMDVENYLDYMIAEIFAGNQDWPGNNVKFWRRQTSAYEPTALPGHDGRWRWIMHDLDQAFGLTSPVSSNLLAKVVDPGAQGTPYAGWETHLFRRLLQNPQVEEHFINRAADLLNTQFKPERTVPIIQNARDKIAAALPEHIERWRSPANFSAWENLFTKTSSYPTGLYTFANQRPAILRQHYIAQFALGGVRDVTVDVSAASQGYVQVNTVEILETTPGINPNPYPWTGQYYQNLPVRLTAHARPGFSFARWVEGMNVLSTDSVLVLNLPGNRSVKAEFRLAGPCMSLKSGDWHTTSTWSCGQIPTATDEVIVRDGHEVTLGTANADAFSLELRDGGTLQMAATYTLHLHTLE